ncbi:hypothetical protein QVD17_29475 [Tagetes erecta]|uniref:F-box/LRR-repeat protein 15-like leucin rich repeat domain-containing protein n=1 Tax=Tagetes erecta TaxID=13708 RepID=A0AAD8NT22_TARER|nr:hypothetical protein QVD17_29475 [Tagetes erecta]
MEPLGDDELLYIFDKIPYYDMQDKRSFPQVSKQFMKVACIRLYLLNTCFPDMLFDILPSCSNMRYFSCSKPLSNAHLKLLAQSCPKLLSLGLSLDLDPSSEPGEFDIIDDGLCLVANACSHLRKVYLRWRLDVGDTGIVSLATSCKNLIHLHLEGCVHVTDESLKAIGETGVRDLSLVGCCLVTDLGLEYLANGDLKKCLQKLNLSKSDKISDHGIIHLQQMVGLTELNLSKCGFNVTDSAIVTLFTQLVNIEILDLSWLINVTDISLLTIGSKCLKLQKIYLSGCEAITAEGLRAFTGHETLKRLSLFSCYNFSWEDVESVALTCMKLEYLGLMKSIKTPMPEASFDYLQIERRFCGIDWDEDSDYLFW